MIGCDPRRGETKPYPLWGVFEMERDMGVIEREAGEERIRKGM
jgi:hypothetical protein